MTAYLNTITGEYPLYEGDIRLSFPNIGEEFVCPEGVVPVTWVDPPTVEVKEMPYIVGAEQTSDGWKTKWAVRVMTDEEWEAQEAARLAHEERMNPGSTKPGSVPDVIE